MALVIDYCVVPDAERHVLRRLQNLRSERFRALAMTVDVFDIHQHLLMKLTSAHRLEGPAGAPNHDVTGAGEQLGMANDPVAVGGAEPFAKAECAAQPVDSCRHICVDENRNDRRHRSGLIGAHAHLLVCESIPDGG